MATNDYAFVDTLYWRGYEDARRERDYDPRGTPEWQQVIDIIAAEREKRSRIEDTTCGCEIADPRDDHPVGECQYHQELRERAEEAEREVERLCEGIHKEIEILTENQLPPGLSPREASGRYRAETIAARLKMLLNDGGGHGD